MITSNLWSNYVELGWFIYSWICIFHLPISPIGAEVWDISTLPLKPLCSIPDSAPSALARHWGEISQPVAGGGPPVVKVLLVGSAMVNRDWFNELSSKMISQSESVDYDG